MSLKSFMKHFSISGKVIVTDNANLYQRFDCYSDCFLWICQNKEQGARKFDYITSSVDDGKPVAYITIK